MLAAGFAVGIVGCLRPTWPAPAPLENDRSIVFPQFFEHSTVEIEAGTTACKLDGVVLKAIMIAMNDYLRPDARDQTCMGSPEAHRFRVVRQENIIFVRIDEDLELCGLQYLSLDSGASYAISTDGRILRRVFDGGPDKVLDTAVPDAGVHEGASPPMQQGGGSAPENRAPPAVSPSALDGGSPGGPRDHPNMRP
jgi:hypothetical protein